MVFVCMVRIDLCYFSLNAWLYLMEQNYEGKITLKLTAGGPRLEKGCQKGSPEAPTGGQILPTGPPQRRPSPHAPLASSVGAVAPLRSTTDFRKLLQRRLPPCRPGNM